MILETKATLEGLRKEFHCRKLRSGQSAVTVLFISETAMQVAHLELPPGTVTFGHFWAQLPYNLYHWMSADGLTVGHYFNIADRTHIAHDTLSWRDLKVDVLCRPGIAPEILDEDELPADLAPTLRTYVEQGVGALLAALPALLPEVETAADELWLQVFGQRRATPTEMAKP